MSDAIAGAGLVSVGIMSASANPSRRERRGEIAYAPQIVTAIAQSVAKAYAIQACPLARRLARNERLVEVEMRLTSRAKVTHVGVEDLIQRRLTDAAQLREGGISSEFRRRCPEALQEDFRGR